ncbi:MAG TPA: FtsX-like permease family protein [Verrucomicrobiae bacterium]|nr:FtsX-like permease family protein [Verrucomicrobiae bacterium]
MKYLSLIFANLGRKKLRTALTVGSFAVALFLFGLLVAIKVAFDQGSNIAGTDRLITINKVSIIQPLPISYEDRIARIPGVKHITFDVWFGGIYQDPKNFFPSFAIDPVGQREVYTELVVPDDQWKKFLGDREGAIVGEPLAKRFGWKVGDRVPLMAPIYGTDAWEFNIDGIFHTTRQDEAQQFWLQYSYLDERRKFGKGQIGWYAVQLESSDDAVRVEKTIDAMFANSPYETKTDTEKAFAASWAKQAGNIEFLILAIGGVVFFTLLLVSGNTMAITVRERVGELAVLKAVGFSDATVMIFVLAESLMIALIGGVLGLALCVAVIPGVAEALQGFLPTMELPVWTLAPGLAFALLIGALAGILPALSAMRLRVVDALRRV